MGPGRLDLARRVEERLLRGMDASGAALREGRTAPAEPFLPPPPGDRPLLVACSGGPDSLVLLHLLRFGCRGLPPLEVAHLDHGMRPGSGADARWLAGVCRSWEIPFHVAELDPPPTSETEARRRRHAWLEAVVQDRGASRLLLGHHADDQVETVLFRAIRGTGVSGLRGMDAVRPPALLRPLLPEPRAALEGWARQHDLRPRVDPTNRDLQASRNRLRHRVLPELEATHPGARAALVRLGRRAREHEEALAALLEGPLQEVMEEAADDVVVVARNPFLSYAFPVRAELLRRLAGRLGIRLGESGTVDAVAFVATGRPGGRLPLPGGGSLHLGRRQFRLERGRPPSDRHPAGTSGDRMSISTPEGVARSVGAESFQRVLFSEERIRDRVRVMGQEITRHYGEGTPVLVLGLLKGSFIFLADLVRTIHLPLQVDFLVASSYGSDTVSSGEVQLLYDPDTTFRDRHVLLVEDIVDSGNTLNRLVPLLRERGPRSLEICALLHKRLTTMETEARWVGFDCPSEFVVGYGLDHAENFRHLPFIGSL